jgi:hypothetical protein
MSAFRTGTVITKLQPPHSLLTDAVEKVGFSIGPSLWNDLIER